ncbi:MAG: SAM-dependent methyltransferase [Promethearchaeia archaeon]|nr:MAG: SAM-dependent methyltransferase [Candidatus Lokiarchaeia archaeon]
MINQQRIFWNEIAEEKEFATPFHLEVFSQYLSPEANILDYGCGYGRILYELYKAGYKNTVGIDISEKMIIRGKSIHPYLNLHHIEGNRMDQVQFDENTFDAIITQSLFTCIPFEDDQKNIIQQIKQMLKPGGYLFFTDFLITPNSRNRARYTRFEKKYNHYGIFELPNGGVFRHYSQKEISELLSDFNIILSNTEVFTTMNGNLTNGIFCVAQKQK